MKINLIFVVIALLNLNLLYSQSEELFPIGINIGFQYTKDNADKIILNGDSTCCPGEMNGDGNSINYGIFYQYHNPFNIDYLSLTIGLDYSNYSSLIFFDENEAININGEPFVGKIRHSIELKVHSIKPEIGLNYNLIPFFVQYKLSLEYIYQNNYTQKEEIILPIDRGVFEDTQQRTRNYNNSSINTLSLPISNQFIIGILINMRPNLLICPGLSFGYRTSILPNHKWDYLFYGINLNVIFIK